MKKSIKFYLSNVEALIGHVPYFRALEPFTSPSKPRELDLSKVLNPDGKHLPEEKESRKKHGLRIICVFKDHMFGKCLSHKKNIQGQPTLLGPIPENSEGGDPAYEVDSSGPPN